jgi:hypothetical protein
MTLGWLLRTSQTALHAAEETFRPSCGATPLQVRRNGAITVAVGLLFFCISGAVLVVLPGDTALRAAAMPSLAGYAFIVVGGYRVLTGRSPEASAAPGASMKRILVAIAAAVLFVFVPLAVFVGASIALERR